MKSFKLFVLLLSGITLLYSCGKPTTPETVPVPDISGGYKIVTKYQTSAYAQDVLKKDNLLYVAQGEGGLEIIDITHVEEPQTVSVFTDQLRGYSIKVELKDDMVYLANGFYGVFGVKADDPLNPMFGYRLSSLEHAKNIHMMGDYMFTAVSEDGVEITYVENTNKPDLRSTRKTEGFAYGLTTTADESMLMVACGELGLYIYNISDFQEGYGGNAYPQVAFCDTPGKAEQVILLEEKSIAFMACGTAGLQIIDYSDTSNVHVVGSFDGGGYAKDLLYDTNDRIYLSTELSGLQIINVADLTNPTIVGKIDTEFSLGLVMDDDYIYLADEIEGLIVIAKPE